MKKYIVLPYNVYEKILTNGNSQQDFIKENNLKNILNENKPANVKRILYQQELQKVINNNKNLNANISNDKNNILNTEKYLDLLKTILPKTLIGKGICLFEYLRDSPHFTWSDNGEIIIDTLKIDGTNIIDFIVDLTRNKPSSAIAGWDVIKDHLKKINIPFSLIGNEKATKNLLSDDIKTEVTIKRKNSTEKSAEKKVKIENIINKNEISARNLRIKATPKWKKF